MKQMQLFPVLLVIAVVGVLLAGCLATPIDVVDAALHAAEHVIQLAGDGVPELRAVGAVANAAGDDLTSLPGAAASLLLVDQAYPRFNRLVVFSTSEHSNHGPRVPNACPIPRGTA